MELKVSIKDGNKETSFKFVGDLREVADSVVTRLEWFWDQVSSGEHEKPSGHG